MELSSGCSLCTDFVLQKECLDLRPCHCVLCKDCFIKLLWGMRGKEAIVCPSCSASVLDYGGLSIMTMAATPTITVGPAAGLPSSTAIPQPLGAIPFWGATTMTPQIVNNNYPSARDIPHVDENPANAAQLPPRIDRAYHEVGNGDEISAAITGEEQQQKGTPLAAVLKPHKTRKIAPSTASLSKADQYFEERFRELQQFQQEHGTLEVPHGEYPALSAWATAIRSKRRSVTPSQRMRLESMGFFGAGVPADGGRRPRTYRKRKTFDDRLEALGAYKEQNGDCSVPYHYTLDPSLGEVRSRARRVPCRCVSFFSCHSSSPLPISHAQQPLLP